MSDREKFSLAYRLDGEPRGFWAWLTSRWRPYRQTVQVGEVRNCVAVSAATVDAHKTKG